MQYKFWLLALLFLIAFKVDGLADEEPMKKEIKTLNQRVELIEQQLAAQEPGESDSEPFRKIGDQVSIGGVLAGTYQYQEVYDPAGAEDEGGGALIFQPEIGVTLTAADVILVKFGFAADNALNDRSPFVLAPLAADLEDDVKDINSRDRDYLLTVRYKHTFQFSNEHSLGLTGGLIDATDYLDENAYSNDEFTQFMNEALVNGPNAFLPSYDIGGAFEWEYGSFALKGVVMSIGENEDGNSYMFYGAQIGYNFQSELGEGNYRVIIDSTSDDFFDPTGIKKEARQCLIISLDQEFGEIIGAWIRFGIQDDSAAIIFESIHSGGINISGNLWGREDDDLGIGYAYLDGGNQDIDRTQVAEAYLRFAITEIFALTFDLQYIEDQLADGFGEDVDGWICGCRLTAEF